MAKAHQAKRIVFVFARGDEARNVFRRADFATTFSARLHWRRRAAGPDKDAMPAAMQANGSAPEEPDRRTVDVEATLSEIGVKYEYAIERARDHGVHLIFLGGEPRKHMRRKFDV